MVLTLGGDHSIAIGTVAGVGRAVRERAARARSGGGDVGDGDEGEVAVVWVDAHADINTPESSASGNVHGMPVAFLTGLARQLQQQRANGVEKASGDGKLEGDEEDVFGWLDRDDYTTCTTTSSRDTNGAKPPKPILNLNKLVYIGLRDVDSGEKEILRREGIKAFSMHDIDKYDTPLPPPPPPSLFPISLFRKTYSPTPTTQTRNRPHHDSSPLAHSRTHANPPLLRRRRARPAMGALNRHARPRRLDVARR